VAACLLFLETPEGDGPESPFGLDFARSSMADLRNLGILQDVVGLVVGRPFRYTDSMREEYEKTTLDLCYGTDYPILCNVDIGHTDPILTLPLDAMVSLDSEKDSFEILEPGVVS
jgi:muramoyltetrapeptide carboxypeptidase LdcA involved in peptidoglycan recycling